MVAASGGSTNGALHLPAIAHECGIAFDLHDVAAIFRDTPYIADLKPAGRYVMKDLARGGRRAFADEGAARRRLPAWRLHHGHRPDDRRESGRHDLRRDAGGGPPDQPADHQLGRRRRAQGHARAGRCDREGGRPAQPQVPRAGARVRVRGGRHGGSPGTQLPGGRGAGDPLRRPQGRPRHARDAGRDIGDLRPGNGRQGGA